MSLPKPYYQDDYCTIYNADCRKILPFLEPVDLVLTDPPYDFESKGGGFYGNWHGAGLFCFTLQIKANPPDTAISYNILLIIPTISRQSIFKPKQLTLDAPSTTTGVIRYFFVVLCVHYVYIIRVSKQQPTSNREAV